MSFLIQPLKDLTVPLYTLATGNDRHQAITASEQWIQAALRTALAAGFIFMTIATYYLIQDSLPVLTGVLLVLIGSATWIHPYSNTLSASGMGLFLTIILLTRGVQDRSLPDGVKGGVALIATSLLLYMANSMKTDLWFVPCDQKIVNLSKTLAPYLVSAFRYAT